MRATKRTRLVVPHAGVESPGSNDYYQLLCRSMEPGMLWKSHLYGVRMNFYRGGILVVVSFKFTNADGVSCQGRFSIPPETGTEYLSGDAAAAKSERRTLLSSLMNLFSFNQNIPPTKG